MLGAIERRPSAASRFAIRFIETYRERVSHRLRTRCRFVPGCSEYGLECYRRYGFVTATLKTVWRLLRCNPLLRRTGVYDPP